MVCEGVAAAASPTADSVQSVAATLGGVPLVLLLLVLLLPLLLVLLLPPLLLLLLLGRHAPAAPTPRPLLLLPLMVVRGALGWTPLQLPLPTTSVRGLPP